MKNLNAHLVYAAVISSLFLFISPLRATTCANAIPITAFPVVNQALVCGTANNLNSVNVPAECDNVNSVYKDGKEALYTFMPSYSGNYFISYTGNGQTSIFVYAGCPNSGGSCIGGIGSSTTSKILSVSLTAGITYFIWFDSWMGSPGSCPGTFSFTGSMPNDICLDALSFPAFPTDGSCASVMVSTENATGTNDATCTGSEDDDVWYTFTTPPGTTRLQYSIAQISGSTPQVFQLFEGTCASLTSIGCYNTTNGVIEDLSSNTTYYLRVFSHAASPAISAFQICLRLPPANDDCTSALSFPTIPLDGNCASITANTTNATGNGNTFCTNTQEPNDIWFSFTTPPGISTLFYENTNISGNADYEIKIYRGNCNNLTQIACYDEDSGTISDLTPNTTYYLIFYSDESNTYTKLDICLRASFPNDDCNGATPFPTIPSNGDCAIVTGSTANATGPSQPICGGNADDNVWFSFITPPGANTVYYDITSVSGNTDLIIGLTQGNCNTSMGCFDAENGILTGLVGNTLYNIQVFTKDAGINASFNICLRVPPALINDDCSGAIPLPSFPLDGSCIATTISTIGATGSSDNTCFGLEDDDVWYTFTTLPGQTSLYYGITNMSGNVDPVLQILSGTCPNTLALVTCYFDKNGVITGLTSNTTYYLRVYTYETGITASFDLCIGRHLQPANDECASAFVFPTLPSGGSCATLMVTTTGATGTVDATCTGTEDDDVWYAFTTPQGTNALLYDFTDISGSTSRAFQVFQGTCSGLVSIGCYTPTAGGFISGLSGNTTYYLRIYTQPSGVSSTFQLCLRLMVPVPPNDECSGAITFPDIPSDGSGALVFFTTFGATGTPDNTCQGTEDDDVWFTFTLPPGVTTALYNYNTVEGNQQVYFQLFSGDCGNLTLVGCYTATRSFIPNLSSDSTYYLRFYTPNLNTSGSYEFTLRAAAVNDECSGAISIDFPLNAACTPVLLSPANATRNTMGGNSLCFPTYADLWYTFSVPPGTTDFSYQIEGSNNYAYWVQLFSGNCSGLTSLGCYQNDDGEGLLTGLTSGVTYYLRIYFFSSSTAPAELCLRKPPLNDACPGAVAFPPIPTDGSYTSLTVSTFNATGVNDPTCLGIESGDVWYTFTTPPGVTSLSYYATVAGVPFQLFRGNDCSTLTHIGCYYYHEHKEQLTGLTGNTTYYLRVYHGYDTNTSFDIRLGISLNDECSGAIAFPDLPTDGSCSSVTGSTVLSTEGNITYTCTNIQYAGHDVWFSFTTPNESIVQYEIESLSGNTNFTMQLFRGQCGNLTSTGCHYGDESGSISNLIGGTTYYLRVYTWDDEIGAEFSICLRLLVPVPPVNDDCSGALAFPDIPLDGSCSMVTATTSPTINANDPACMGNEDDDVWFTFTTPPGVTTLLFETSPAPDDITPVLQVFSGECGTLTSIGCYQEDHAAITGLSGGTTYYLRVYSYYSNRGSTNICLRLLLNEECPDAIAFPTIPLDGSCTTMEISTYFSVNSTTFAHCEEGEQGDVWYKFTTPPDVTEVVYLKTGSNVGLRFQVFSGGCNDLTAIGCFIASSYGLITGLSGNTTYYLRAYTASALNTTHTVNFCLRLLPNDNCSGAVPFPAIPLNGSCASVVGSTIGTTGSASATCAGVEDDDLWYTFTTPPGFTTLRYEITNIVSISDHPLYKDMVLEIFTNSCEDMISLGCYDPEQGVITGLNGSTSYYMRVYTKAAPSDHVTLFNICLRRPPSNDFCSGAIAIPDLPLNGSCATVNISTVHASPSGLLNCVFVDYSDVWHTFTTPLDVESVLYEIPGISAIDAPVLEIFSGSCNNLTSLGCFDSTKGVFTGLSGGTTYYLRTHSDSSFSPDVTFDICLQATPVNDVCHHALPFPTIPTDGSFSTVIANTARATGVNDPTCSGGESDDVWFAFKTPLNVSYLLYECQVIAGSSPANFQVFSGSCNQLTSIGCYSSMNNGDIVITGLTGNTTYYVRAYSASEAQANHSIFSISLRVPLVNDNCASAILIGGCNATINGTFHGATADELVSDCVVNIGSDVPGLWYRLIGDGLPVTLHTCFGNDSDAGILVYSGSCGSLVCVTGNQGACSSGSLISLAPAIGEEYYIFVYSSSGDNFTLSFIGGAQCPNVIGQTTVSIDGATATISWPEIAGVESYDYTLSANGICSSGTATSTTSNSVSFPNLETNTQYTFCLRSNCSCYETDFASISFAVPLVNDYCATAIPALCGTTITGSTEGAISDSSLGNCGSGTGVIPGKGVWYKLSGDGSLIMLDLCFSSFDTKVHVYSGTCGNLLCVASNNDACGTQSNLSFHALSGHDYFILVNGTDSNTGDFAMEISCICDEPLGTPWTVTDVGGAAGTAINNYCGGTIDISSDGVSASSASDVRLFAFQNFCDTVAITAKVNHTTTGDFAGIVLRENTTAGARMIALKSKGTKYVYLEVRSVANGSKQTQQFLTSNHRWLRMVRNGDQIIGYSSGNGVHWQQHFAINLALPSCIDAGLFAESTQAGASAVGAFSNVSIVPSTSTIVLPNGEFPTEENPTEGGGTTPDYFVYPNPTESAINVKMGKAFTGKELTITIINQLGQMMANRKIREVQELTETFDVRQFPPGVYIITLSTESGGTLATKFIVGASTGSIRY